MSLALGDLAPDFSLPGTDGATHSLSQYADKPALVVIFSCNHCPYVQAYEGRMVALQQAFGERGAQLICINSNETAHYPEDSFDNMVTRAREQLFNFPYLRDETQEVARAYGAERTPHIFAFDAARRLAYTGAIDDNWKEPTAVTRHHLREALEDLLAGRPVAEPSTHAIGCSVKWNV